MAVAGCTKCIKYMLFFFNFIFWVSWTLLWFLSLFAFLQTSTPLNSSPNICIFNPHICLLQADKSSEGMHTVSQPLCDNYERRAASVETTEAEHSKSWPATSWNTLTLHLHSFSGWLSASARWLTEERGALQTGWASVFSLGEYHVLSSRIEAGMSEVVVDGKLKKLFFSFGWFLLSFWGRGELFPSDISFVPTWSPDCSICCL